MVGDHEAGTVESLGLVDQHVAPLVVGIISHHHTSWGREGRREGGRERRREGEREGGREGGRERES